MRRGTTPTLTFTLPVDSSIIERLFITFSQKRGIVLEKNIDDCEFIDGALQVTLSQKETLLFNVGAIDIQIRLKTNDGYDEYIWLSDSSKFEKIGNTDIDLSAYLKSADVTELSNTEIQNLWDSVS